MTPLLRRAALLCSLLGAVPAQASCGPAPGLLNPGVRQDNIARTICVPGWSAAQRPPVDYTDRIKLRLLPAGARPVDYELDHCIPISLGGSPRDPRNLWLQPMHGSGCSASAKDIVELQLHHDVCTGKITLLAARGTMRGWSQHCVALIRGK